MNTDQIFKALFHKPEYRQELQVYCTETSKKLTRMEEAFFWVEFVKQSAQEQINFLSAAVTASGEKIFPKTLELINNSKK